MTTDPIRRFEEEHTVALAALDRLEAAAEALRSGARAEPQLAIAREVHGLLCGAVRQHNEDEERALFPVLGESAPLAPFLEEHETLWSLEAGLKTALHANGTNIEGDWDEVFAAVRRCHEVLHGMGVPRVSATLRVGTRTDKVQSLEDKVKSVEEKMK